MIHLNIKPLSVNKCRQGKRFKTKIYLQYEKLLMLILKPMKIPKGRLKIEFVFGFSSSRSDRDNPIKPFQDILQKKYGFDDKQVFEANIKKKIVKKGDEFIKFRITPIPN